MLLHLRLVLVNFFSVFFSFSSFSAIRFSFQFERTTREKKSISVTGFVVWKRKKKNRIHAVHNDLFINVPHDVCVCMPYIQAVCTAISHWHIRFSAVDATHCKALNRFYVCDLFYFPFSQSASVSLTRTFCCVSSFFFHAERWEASMCMHVYMYAIRQWMVLCFHIATWHAMRIHWVLQKRQTLSPNIQTRQKKPNKHTAHVVCMRSFVYEPIHSSDRLIRDCFTLRIFRSRLTCSKWCVSFQLIYLQKNHPEKKVITKKTQALDYTMIDQRLHVRVDMMAHLKPEIKSIHILW